MVGSSKAVCLNALCDIESHVASFIRLLTVTVLRLALVARSDCAQGVHRELWQNHFLLLSADGIFGDNGV